MYIINNVENKNRLIECLEKEQRVWGNTHFSLCNIAYHTVLKGKDVDYQAGAAYRRENIRGLRFVSEEALHTCGSTACVIGTWNTHHPDEMLYGTHRDLWGRRDRFGNIVDPPQACSDYTLISEWLGMDKDDALMLFGYYPHWECSFRNGELYREIKELVTLPTLIRALKEAVTQEERDTARCLYG